ncbi:hypothetical protein F2P81_021565 [Scophthalmus maximus]|uniref:CRAL-TRIO domain-containing protein n=1 Tax=Scophthalmus maximus TaxID=52904 RepID=A0A6A4S3T5_SCOMX|nr:hypothetical protein F2P81_021565 [Scophthalmus maximus]
MDPLGARSQFVDVQTLPTWQQQLGEEDGEETPRGRSDSGDSLLDGQRAFPSPFPCRPDINRKIILFTGDIALLNCTAIVNTSNESLSDKNPVSDGVHQLAGPELRDELLKLKGTVRRFLESHGNSIDAVVFAVTDAEESVYKKLLPLYYPRSADEEKACLPLIPADIGNSEGEPVVPERQIRIAEKPGTLEGLDMCGRTVMVVVGRNIPVTLIDLEKALLYFIHVMDHIAVKEYVVVYFHTLTGEHNHLHADFLKTLYDIVDAKFKKNLKAFYYVHPTFRSKVSTWFFTTFSVSGIKDKVCYLDNLHQLFTCIKPEQIDIPPFVLEYDARNLEFKPFNVSGWKFCSGMTLKPASPLSAPLWFYFFPVKTTNSPPSQILSIENQRDDDHHRRHDADVTSQSRKIRKV